jgi:hypothetical protein
MWVIQIRWIMPYVQGGTYKSMENLIELIGNEVNLGIYIIDITLKVISEQRQKSNSLVR